MPQFIMPQREFAGVSGTMATATIPLSEPHEPRRRVVALGWISRRGGQVAISGRLSGTTTTPAGWR